MKYVLDVNETKKADSEAISGKGVPGLILMENAARSAADIIKRKLAKNSDVLILCGVGNNGGDGFAMARHLQDNYQVKIAILGDESKMSPETRTNFRALAKLGYDILHLNESTNLDSLNLNFDCIIDSLIGVGGSEKLRGPIIDILKKVNQSKAFKVAIDVPSGLNADNGLAHENAFKADLTVTMFAIKKGLILKEGPALCGEIVVADLGVTKTIVEKIAKEYILEISDIRKILKQRLPKTSKFDYGKVMIIAGSKFYPGAAALCANASVRSGAGLVYLYTNEISNSIFPEIIPTLLSSNESAGISSENLSLLKAASEKCDVIAIGPGLGDSADTLELTANLIKEIDKEKTIIVDADAHKALTSFGEIGKNVIITPHTGEFALISGINRAEVEKNVYELAHDFASKSNCIVLLKNHVTAITDGKKSYYNFTGNAGMATGGSGDVLTGIIAALAAQSVPRLEAAALGAFIHGLAGDFAANNYSQESMRPSDIIECIPLVFKASDEII